jgi:hypothetical protein
VRRPALPLLVALALLLLSAVAAAAPRLAFEPRALAFAIDDPQPSERSVTVRNIGDTTLHIAGVFLSPDSSGFHVDSPGPTELMPGAAIGVAVRYTPGRLARDATGALLVVSDDPRGSDDPRTDEPDHVLGLPLRVGGTSAALGLFGPPLAAALLLAGLAAAGRGRTRAAAWLDRIARAAPLLATAWLARGFQPELTALDGGYGIQRLSHHVLSTRLALEYFVGFDGLSLPLVALVALWGVLAVRPSAPGSLSPTWRLLILGGTLLALGALDVVLLAAGWLLALLGAGGELGLFQRSRPAGAPRLVAAVAPGLLAVTLALLGGALALARARSLPTALVDGTFVAHSGDLIKLTYQNYFGDQRLGGLALDGVLWVALQAAALLPLGALLVARAPDGQRLLVAGPLAVLALYASVRLGGGLFPHAARALVPWLGGLGLLGAAVATLRALRTPTLSTMLPGLLAAQLAATALGLSAGTQAGLHAALLGLWRFVLGAGLLGLRPPGAATARGERLIDRLIGRGTALLVLGAPGLLGFPAQVLLLVGTAPTQRLATGALVGLWLLLIAQAARRGQATRRGLDPVPQPIERTSGWAAPLAPRLVLLGVAVALGILPQALVTASASWVNDFLSHTVGHLGPAALALLQAGARL